MTIPTRVLSKHASDFIDDAALEGLLAKGPADDGEARAVIAKALTKQALSVAETAVLLRGSPAIREEVYAAAHELKQRVYGNRIVLFAPLYVGSDCVNDCAYCGFRSSNLEAVRRTLSDDDLAKQVRALEDRGHKRVIVVFGEHPAYDADFIARTVKQVYAVKSGPGEIRRINVNAAPLDHEGFRRVHEAGIGTFQIFMETYHHATYRKMHPEGTPKGDYLWRLDAMNRAYEAGLDDVGIGALFGLGDWRFDVLGLVSHAIFLQEKYGCGPHTISFPRLRHASGLPQLGDNGVSDEDFKFLIATLRLAVPYTGMILTAREPAALRREIMAFGVSQIDGGTRLEIGGYTREEGCDALDEQQFELADARSLDEVMKDLLDDQYLPSFCTSCYRTGRHGKQFMEFAIPGFIQKFCTPNALLTLAEYLDDYGTPAIREAGDARIRETLATIEDGVLKEKLIDRLHRIRTKGERDLYF